MKIINCKICLTPNTRPRVKFGEDGICNACHYKDEKNKINWDDRKVELEEICNKFRSKTSDYDCIVPWSGGKDSSSIAYKLKFDHGMNPLLVTFSPLLPSNVGIQNRKNFLNLGFDNIYFYPNEKVSKLLAKRFFLKEVIQKFIGMLELILYLLKLLVKKISNLFFMLNMVKVSMVEGF
jgi:hypothetical protein